MSQYVKNSAETQKRGRGFQKGNKLSHGRPKTAKCIPDILREIGDRPVTPWLLAQLHQKYGPEHNPKNMREAMLMAAMADATLGDKPAIQFISDRTEGKVVERMEVSDTTPMRVQFVEVRSRIIPRKE